MSGGDQLNLGWAVLCGNVEDVTRVLDEGVPVNSRASDGWIALHRACFNNKPNIVKLLLKYKANKMMMETHPFTKPSIWEQWSVSNYCVPQGHVT